jgi:hypothetical protein
MTEEIQKKKTTVSAPMTKDLLMKYTLVALVILAATSVLSFGIPAIIISVVALVVAIICDYLISFVSKKKDLYPKSVSFRMPDSILEEYIIQHIAASSGSVINFSWHGGEPTILGLEYFRKIVALQRKHQPRNQRIRNGIQTNGTLLDEAGAIFWRQRTLP